MVWSEWIENTGIQPVDDKVWVEVVIGEADEEVSQATAGTYWWPLGESHSISRYRYVIED